MILNITKLYIFWNLDKFMVILIEFSKKNPKLFIKMLFILESADIINTRFMIEHLIVTSILMTSGICKQDLIEKEGVLSRSLPLLHLSLILILLMLFTLAIRRLTGRRSLFNLHLFSRLSSHHCWRGRRRRRRFRNLFSSCMFMMLSRPLLLLVVVTVVWRGRWYSARLPQRLSRCVRHRLGVVKRMWWSDRRLRFSWWRGSLCCVDG